MARKKNESVNSDNNTNNTNKKTANTNNNSNSKTATPQSKTTKTSPKRPISSRAKTKKDTTATTAKETVEKPTDAKDSATPTKSKPSKATTSSKRQSKTKEDNSVVELKFVLVNEEETQQAATAVTQKKGKAKASGSSKKATRKNNNVQPQAAAVDASTSPQTKKEESPQEVTPKTQAATSESKEATDPAANPPKQETVTAAPKDEKVLNIPKINFFLPKDKEAQQNKPTQASAAESTQVTITASTNNNKDNSASAKTSPPSPKEETSVPQAQQTDTIDKSNPFIEDSPAIESDSQKAFTWVQYSSDKITRTYFIPLLGAANRFYPRLYYCENRVKLVTFINGEQVIYEENSVSDKRTDFDFLSVLLQWRIQYMKSCLYLDERYVDAWIALEDDLIALHNLIRIRYTDSRIKDLVQFVNASNEIVNRQLFNHKDFIFTNVHGYTEVEISKLYIKYEIEFKLKNTDRKFQKRISVILE